MPKSAPERIAIVGGGFSGVMTAVNLVRLSQRPLQVTVINYQRSAGRGVAYGTRRREHLLNVAARNMSALRDEPDHFLRWLRTRSEFDTVPEIELRERFIPRMVSRLLLALGPLLRGTPWETIAVPELRAQAKRVAETLLDQPPVSVGETEVMMEYMI